MIKMYNTNKNNKIVTIACILVFLLIFQLFIALQPNAEVYAYNDGDTFDVIINVNNTQLGGKQLKNGAVFYLECDINKLVITDLESIQSVVDSNWATGFSNLATRDGVGSGISSPDIRPNSSGYRFSTAATSPFTTVSEGTDLIIVTFTIKSGGAASDYAIAGYASSGGIGQGYGEVTIVMPVAKYPITIDDTIINGAVTSDVDEATEGDPVTLTVTPDEDYSLQAGSLSVTPNVDDLAQVGTSNQYTFTMPDEAVTVTASFLEDALSGAILQLQDAITQAETALGVPGTDYKISTDGKDVANDIQWVSQGALDTYQAAIQTAKDIEESLADALTGASVAIGAKETLDIAKSTFEAALKSGTDLTDAEKAAAKEAADKKLADEKAAAEKAAADKKAADEKAAADKKLADEKAAAEKLAGEDLLATEQKAIADKAAADKALATQKKAETTAAALIPPVKNATLAVAKKAVTVKIKAVSGATKYTVRYKVKGTKTWKEKTITAKQAKNGYKIKNLKKGKKYEIQYRVTKKAGAAQKAIQSKWSKSTTTKKVK